MTDPSEEKNGRTPAGIRSRGGGRAAPRACRWCGSCRWSRRWWPRGSRWTTYSKEGPTITITFETAGGLRPGKTKIKYRDVPLGVVTAVRPQRRPPHVVVTAEMDKSAADQLHEDTEFWIENARVDGVGRLGPRHAGLGRLHRRRSRAPGKPARKFKGREEPPVLQVTVPGTRYTLHSDKRGSISANSPIYFRGIAGGRGARLVSSTTGPAK